MSMVMITPETIGTSELTSTTAAYLNPEWSSANSYSIGDLVYSPIDFQVYEALIASSPGAADPSTNPLDGSDNPYWLRIGPSNPWAMFDEENNTQTLATTSLEVVIEAGRIDTLSFFNVTGVTEITVNIESVSSGVSPLFNETFTMSEMGGVGMWAWLFSPRITRTNLFVDGWLGYADCVITVTFAGSDIGVGNMVVGSKFDIGNVAEGMTITPKDGSIIEINDFQQTSYTELPSYYEVQGSVAVDRDRVDAVVQRIFNTKGPKVFICTEKYTTSYVFGISSTFSVRTSVAEFNVATFKLTGVI